MPTVSELSITIQAETISFKQGMKSFANWMAFMSLAIEINNPSFWLDDCQQHKAKLFQPQPQYRRRKINYQDAEAMRRRREKEKNSTQPSRRRRKR